VIGSYASHFVPIRSDVPFLSYNWFCDPVHCGVACSMKCVKERRICVESRFRVRKAATCCVKLMAMIS
jgi:hypothetical protein